MERVVTLPENAKLVVALVAAAHVGVEEVVVQVVEATVIIAESQVICLVTVQRVDQVAVAVVVAVTGHVITVVKRDTSHVNVPTR